MSQERLSRLVILLIENEILEKLMLMLLDFQNSHPIKKYKNSWDNYSKST